MNYIIVLYKIVFFKIFNEIDVFCCVVYFFFRLIYFNEMNFVGSVDLIEV